MTHNRIYSAALAAFAVLDAVVLLNGLMELNLAGRGWHEPVAFVPAWAVPWVAAALIFYLVAIPFTLYMRHRRPELGRRLTRWLNWALLPALPCGTVIGLYGLRKVDRVEFDMTRAVADWRRRMLAAGDKTPAALDELEVRLRDEVEEQKWSWTAINEGQAFAIAVQRMESAQTPALESFWHRDLAPSFKLRWSHHSPEALRRQRRYGWTATAIIYPAVNLAFLFEWDKIAISPAQHDMVFAVVGLGLLLHIFVWFCLHQLLPIISRKRALRAAQHGCILVNLIFGLLSLYILLPGLEFSHAISPGTAILFQAEMPSLPLWCLYYLTGMAALTLGCGLEEAAAKRATAQR